MSTFNDQASAGGFFLLFASICPGVGLFTSQAHLHMRKNGKQSRSECCQTHLLLIEDREASQAQAASCLVQAAWRIMPHADANLP
jgi:hypothetical protein